VPIKIIKKGIDQAPEDVVCHGCNCFCVMGAGAALSIRRKYPEVLSEEKRKYTKGNIEILGKVLFVSIDGGKRHIANMHTQYYYGRTKRRYVNYEAVYLCLEEVRRHVERRETFESREVTVGMTKIGCGLAGGSWKIIRLMVKKVFGKRTIKIYVGDSEPWS